MSNNKIKYPSLDIYKKYISLTNIKNVVRVVAKQLLEHINANNLDNPYQSAYKAGHSTETALLYIKK